MNQEEGKPTMLNAEQVAQRLNMSKGFAYKIIQEMNEEQMRFMEQLIEKVWETI